MRHVRNKIAFLRHFLVENVRKCDIFMTKNILSLRYLSQSLHAPCPGACHMDFFSILVQNQVYLAMDIILPSIETVFQILPENLAVAL